MKINLEDSLGTAADRQGGNVGNVILQGISEREAIVRFGPTSTAMPE
jgi:hypothetical protein